ncbi:hypothetical protein [[Phormidium] sp. ETS-05]|uniref:hypothetical protein n=1 Tax=[Phormidium] sp. ETS-05 TaxID=222819 RepID=UPI001E5631E9|nr:hypothetical protein [[Phormidium] sp. ETS-05]
MWDVIQSWLSVSRFIKKRWVGYAIAAGIYGLILILPMPGVEREARLCLGVFGVAVFCGAPVCCPCQ